MPDSWALNLLIMFGIVSRARRSFSEGWFDVQISLLSHSLLLPASPF